MNAHSYRCILGSVGLALGLATTAGAQCFGDKLVDDNPGPGNFMGSAVDLYGSYRVILGAPSAHRVLFFDRTGPTQWSEIDEITSPTGTADRFGEAVAIHSTFAVIGAPDYTDGFDDFTGRAYIYRRTSIMGVPVWVLDWTIDNPSSDPGDHFGRSVDITQVGSQMVVAIGCPSDSVSGQAGAGRVRIYHRNDDGTWSLEDTVTALTPQGDSSFGASLDFDGTQMIVGCPGEDVNGQTGAGAAYLFFRTGTDWGVPLRILAPVADRDSGDTFGADVAIDGHWLAIGASGDNEGLDSDTGAVYVYRSNVGIWSFQQRLLGLNHGAFDWLGRQVDLARGVIVAGDPNNNYGQIWRLDESTDQWNLDFPFIATDPPASGSHSFGSDIALSDNGEYVLVGDGADDIPGSGGTGSAYIFSTDQNPGGDCDGGLFDPVPVLVAGETYNGCNVGNATDGSTTCTNTHADGWYQFTAPCNGVLSLSTCGTHDLGGQDEGIDTVLSVHSGCPGTGNDIACNDDAPNGNNPSACGDFSDQGTLRDAALKVSVSAKQTYRIRVAGYGSSGNEGLFILNVGFSCCRVDWDGNGTVNSTDVSAFINDWFTDQQNGTLITDFNNDGVSNSTDVSDFINEWFAGCEV